MVKNLTDNLPPFGNKVLSVFGTATVCGLALTMTATQASAAGFIGNISSTTPGQGLLFGSSSTISTTQAKSADFLTPDDGITYSLGNVYLALSNFDDGDTELVTIRQDGPDPLLGTPSVQMTLVAPAKTADNSAFVWEFAPSSAFDLLPNTTYSLVVGATGGSFTWGREGFLPETPTGVATFEVYQFSGTNGLDGPFNDSQDALNLNNFQVNATAPAEAVPEPATVLGLVAFGGLGFLAKRNKNELN
jgi:hypothetical protein